MLLITFLFLLIDYIIYIYTYYHPSSQFFSLWQCVKFHPNCNYVATGSSDRSIRLWEVNSGSCVRIFTGHYGAIYSLAFSPDGRILASAGRTQIELCVWVCVCVCVCVCV